MQTLPNLWRKLHSKSPGQVEFCASWNCVYAWSCIPIYVEWQKSNETDFFKPLILFFLQIKFIPFETVPLGSYTAT